MPSVVSLATEKPMKQSKNIHSLVVITGIGWITQKAYGSVIQKLRRDCTDTKSLHSRLQHESVFLYPVKNFGRFDAVSKMTCCAGALALRDAGITYSEHHKQDMGILGTNSVGCLESNVRYFKDYVETGRTLARGNLFIYTLPSSPLAEAAISFGLQGPLLYMMFQQKQIASLVLWAGKMILRGETSGMLAVKASVDEAVCFVLRRGEDVSTGRVFSLENAIAAAEKTSRLDEMIRGFARKPM